MCLQEKASPVSARLIGRTNTAAALTCDLFEVVHDGAKLFLRASGGFSKQTEEKQSKTSALPSSRREATPRNLPAEVDAGVGVILRVGSRRVAVREGAEEGVG